MADIKIAIINKSTVLSDNAVAAIEPVLNIQVHRDFAPAWRIDADVTFVPKGSAPPSGAWWLIILDDSDRGEDLGYHELTDEGLPVGKVFARSDQVRGFEWTATASHELLEMLADPNAHLTVFVPWAHAGFLYAYEVCDPCEAEEYGYQINGTLVSDFVYPAWFEPLRGIRSTQFDYGKYIQGPLQCLPGSHIDVFDIGCRIWRHFRGEGRAYRYEPRPSFGTRRSRRRLPRHRWRKSEVHRTQAQRPGADPTSVELATQVLNHLSSSLDQLNEAVSRLEA